jgi:chaperone LolA
MRVITVTLLLFLFISQLKAAPGSITAKEIISNVKKKYEQLQSLKADFEQEYVWQLAGETQTVKGTLYLRQGNNYRIETDTQFIVTDGQTVWTYSKQNNQVIIDLLKSTEENPLPKDLLFKYSEEYVPHLIGEEKLGEKKTYVLNLAPKDKEAFVKSMKIWVDSATWLTIKIEQKDINDNVNTYEVRNIQENLKLDGALFTFPTPADAEVVDLR